MCTRGKISTPNPWESHRLLLSTRLKSDLTPAWLSVSSAWVNVDRNVKGLCEEVHFGKTLRDTQGGRNEGDRISWELAAHRVGRITTQVLVVFI